MKKILLLLLVFLMPYQELKAAELPILINQIMIGQNESSKNEFIELYNPNDFDVDLKNYYLKKKTISGTESNLVSSKNFVGVIRANKYFLISSKEYGQTIKADLSYSTTASMAKNNSIILYNESKETSDMVGFGEIDYFLGSPCENPENNQILKRSGNTQNNLKDFYIEKSTTKIKNSKNETITILNQEVEENTKTKKVENIQLVSINNLKTLAVGSFVTAEGIVLSLPGVLGSQLFYIIEKDQANSVCINGVQIYNYYKNFPELEIGDIIRVTGELSISNGGYRIKTKEIKDIEIKSKNNKIPEIKESSIEEIENCPINSLVKIKGIITQNKTGSIYIDDGKNEILIDIKKTSGINSKALLEENEYTISGLIFSSDKEKKIAITDESFIGGLEVFTSALSNSELITLKKEKKENKIFYYFVSMLVLIICIYFIRKRIKNLSN
ncbi:MAG: lamin tail domain-containing protein [Patescibacteria group bacterium]